MLLSREVMLSNCRATNLALDLHAVFGVFLSFAALFHVPFQPWLELAHSRPARAVELLVPYPSRSLDKRPFRSDNIDCQRAGDCPRGLSYCPSLADEIVPVRNFEA